MNSSAPSATVLLALIAVAAPIGALDMLYFHLFRFKLYRQPSARAEMVTHLLRGSIMSVGAYLLASYRPQGGWFWVVAGLLCLELINSVVDVALEPASRAPLGGVPRLEHIVHVLGSALVGAIAATYLLIGWPERLAATALAPLDGGIPAWLVCQCLLIATGGALLTLLEAGLFLSALSAPRAVEPYEASTRTRAIH